MQCLARAVRVVRDARVEELDVELLVPVLQRRPWRAAPAGSARTSPTRAGSGAGATATAQPRTARSESRRARAPQPGCRRVGAPRRRCRAARAPLPRRRSSKSSAARRTAMRLEREPDREQLAQLLDVERHHLGSVVRHVLGEPERLELAHRFANRRDAHAELARRDPRAGAGCPGVSSPRMIASRSRSSAASAIVRWRTVAAGHLDGRLHGAGP